MTRLFALVVYPFTLWRHARMSWLATRAVQRKGAIQLLVFVLRIRATLKMRSSAWSHAKMLGQMIAMELRFPGHFTRALANATKPGQPRPVRPVAVPPYRPPTDSKGRPKR